MRFVLPAAVLCLLLRIAATNAFTSPTYRFYASSNKKRRFPKARIPSSSSLRAMMLPPQSLAAAATLVVASTAGFTIDRKWIPNSGIIVSLSLAAMASNLFRVAPSAHVLYDYCWSVVLPMSFSLLMLSIYSDQESLTAASKGGSTTKEYQTVYRVGCSFLLASIGSILGCFLSYQLCCFFPAFFALTAVEAAQATSCLAASFVGGSINFFETAARIPHLNQSLLTAMATADIIIMAIYFAGLSIALNSKILRRLFANRTVQPDSPVRHVIVTPTAPASIMVTRTMAVPIGKRLRNALHAGRRKGLLSIVAIALSLSFTGLSKMLERLVDPYVPGTSCGFLAILIPLFLQSAGQALSPRLRNDLRQVAEPLSALSFLFLFASIGVSVDLRTVAVSGISCLVISLVALICHAIVSLFGAILLLPNSRLEEVLVASNAAIGGPATAAAFCGQCGAQYVLAATVWGVVGYAIGTTVGVAMYRALV
jgi:uncharacterized membrane protein